MIKTLNNLLKNQTSEDLETWHAELGLKLYKACINDDPALTMAYFEVQILSHVRLNGKTDRKLFNGNNLQEIDKLTKDLCL